MPLPFTNLFIGAGTIAAGAGVAVGGTYVYVNADEIFGTSKQQQNTQQQNQSGQGGNVDIEKKQGLVLAEITTIQTNAKASLYKAGNKNYKCILNLTADATKSSDNCELFTISSNHTQYADINFTKARFTNNPLKTQATNAHLTTTNAVLVKLDLDFIDSLAKSQTKEFSINESTNNLLTLKYIKHINGDEIPNRISELQTSLFVLRLSENSTYTTSLTASGEYQCQIGSDAVKLPCKLYINTVPTSKYDINNLKGLTPEIVPKTSFAQSNYVIIELLKAKKTYLDLQHKDIIVTAKSDSTAITKGKFFTLLFGQITNDASTTKLIPIENLDNHTRHTPATDATWRYILTKDAIVHKSINAFTDYPYSCRVIVGNDFYDDESCVVFSLKNPSGDLSTIKPTDYESDANKITQTTDLTTSNKNVVKLKSTLLEKLSTLSTDTKLVHIIKQSDKAKAWGSTIATLQWDSGVTDSTSGVSE